MSTEDITNFIRVDERVLTAGQPTEAQFRDAAAEGVQVVINLGTLNPRYALANEAGLVRSLGLEYHHLPVAWEAPTESDFDAFAQACDAVAGKRVLIHCAANYRVSAFYSLYAMRSLGWSATQARAFRARIWQAGEHPVWDELIARLEARYAAAQ
jgi:protein tyrosine phosphatase (PTP) superfamily phosphohydrolase (DUF442 family)